jgi:hypothetical protein
MLYKGHLLLQKDTKIQADEVTWACTTMSPT